MTSNHRALRARPSQEPATRRSVVGALAGALLLGVSSRALAVSDGAPGKFRPEELVDNGHRFFGSMSRGLAQLVEEATRRWGEPNGYILGQEASGAIVGGVRYGEGTLYTRNAGQRRVYWQGPSIGFDVGGDGDRTMMLVYNLPAVSGLYRRFGGVDGSAYLVGGFGMTAVTADDIVVVPIRTGVGARLGINIGYLKFTAKPTWNPF
ncbi:hypothetical protein ASF58_06500 [Methylobacterium sp. Leaf125]|jgi:hypothetical protein|uniref:DUF1134 domain-containing protein n=1 Tax=Methylobacterium sp. Leaf125 TaxID=1736265 RepID=UPI0006F9943E|nr:DUF1134 domain-containing protein [Methylobacterium sp. Leaf125]KQQ40643.1 hypothetical protein ASF58_06500 [Methylobacterium sp. Leaf125]